jgi:isoquinoline 1-oxidoreductase beta subunit
VPHGFASAGYQPAAPRPGGSCSIANAWEQLRTAGAHAMLIAVAAWRVPAAAITIARGRLHHPPGRRGRFGEFAARAASLPPPREPRPKPPAEWRLIGKPLARNDSREQTHGVARYTIDIVRPGCWRR